MRVDRCILQHRQYLSVTNHLRPGWHKVVDSDDGEAWVDTMGTAKVIWSIARELDEHPWLHASMSRPASLPTYEDLKFLHRRFMNPKRKAMQLFVPDDQHVNLNPNVLHLWQTLGPDLIPDFTRGGRSI